MDSLNQILDVACIVVGLFLFVCALLAQEWGNKLVLALSALVMIGSTVVNLDLGKTGHPVETTPAIQTSPLPGFETRHI